MRSTLCPQGAPESTKTKWPHRSFKSAEIKLSECIQKSTVLDLLSSNYLNASGPVSLCNFTLEQPKVRCFYYRFSFVFLVGVNQPWNVTCCCLLGHYCGANPFVSHVNIHIAVPFNVWTGKKRSNTRLTVPNILHTSLVDCQWCFINNYLISWENLQHGFTVDAWVNNTVVLCRSCDFSVNVFIAVELGFGIFLKLKQSVYCLLISVGCLPVQWGFAVAQI